MGMTTTTMIEESHRSVDLTGAASGGTPPSEEHLVAEVETAQADALNLMAWLSPAFPIGSFAFSHGIEWAVEARDVRDAETTARWIGALIEHGAIRNDCILASAAWRAVAARDTARLREIADLALALSGSRERHLETTTQGNAFLLAIRTAWTTPAVDWVGDALAGSDLAYPVAVGAASAAHVITLLPTLEMFALAVVQNLVSATIRLSALGHTDGQRVIAALLPAARELAAAARHATLDDLGSAAFRSDLAALRHETQYSRLFRS
jgi:urease accessory protein